MGHSLGLSGSTILSDREKLSTLFQSDLDHIEIGEFSIEEDFQLFMDEVKQHTHTFGIHSPLMRKDSKYDLLEHVQMDPERAWTQVELEAERLSSMGAEYILVHFPYFQQERNGDVFAEIERGLEKLSKLQSRYQIPFVCEPKLGADRNPCGIRYLDAFPIERWKAYGLHLCIDVGDYLMAEGDKIDKHIEKWLDDVKVVHLHNVSFQGEKYIWSPVHPSQDHDPAFYQLEPIIRKLAQGSDIHFLFEHTPHHVPSDKYVQEGINWVRSILKT